MKKKDSIFQNLLFDNLKILIIFSPFVIYKYVDYYRANQEAWLRLFLIILSAIWIIRSYENHQLLWKKSKLNLSIQIFLLLISFSLIRSNFFAVSLRDYIDYFFYILLYFLIINNIKRKEEFDYLIKLFLVITSLIAIYVILHYYGIIPYLKEYGPVTSTIGQKNWTSTYLGLFFPLMFFFFLLEEHKEKKILYYLFLSIIYTAIVICQSRGAWISLGLTFIFGIVIICKYKIFSIFQKNRKWLFVLLLTFLIITVIYSTDNFLNRSYVTFTQRAFSTFDQESPGVKTRIFLWENAFHMIKDNPFFGVGLGNFKIHYLEYQAKLIKQNSAHLANWGNAAEAHNEYFQIAAELGLTGLGAFLFIFFTYYKLVLSFFKNEKKTKRKVIFFGLFLGITFFLSHSLFTFPLHVPALGTAFFIILGLSIVYLNNFSLPELKRAIVLKKIRLHRPLFRNLLIALVLFSMVIGIDTMVIRSYLAEVYSFKGQEEYILNHNYDKALSNFEYASRLDPYNGRILLHLGATYCNLGNYEQSKRILTKAKKYISDKNIFRNLGLSYMQSGNYQEAEKEFKHAIYLDPKFYKAYNDLASLYIYEKEYDKAIRQWERGIELNLKFKEKHIFLYYIGMAYQKKQMPNKALEYFIQALQLAPEGSPIIEEIEEELYNIYKGKLDN